MNKELLQVLQYFNLNPKEAEVYLASLQIGQATAYEISKAVNIKQPTVYVITASLVEKGLLSRNEVKSRTYYLPTPPKELINTWKSRVEALDALTPELNSYWRQGTNKPKITVLEGSKGIDQAYTQLVPKDTKGSEILFLGSIASVRDRVSHLFPFWEKTARNKHNTIRELVKAETEIENYASRMLSLNNPHYQIRILKDVELGNCDTLIFENKLAIFSLQDDLFVTIIESAEISKTYRALFELAWQSATP